MNCRNVKVLLPALVCIAGLVAIRTADLAAQDNDEQDIAIAHVLLLSIDGLHAVDLNRYVANNPNSTLAQLTAHGRTYTNATSTKPSDSFPGLLAMVTGGTPRSTGVYYDDGWDRSLAPASGPCVPGARVQWKQNLDLLPLSFATTIDPLKLPLDPASPSSLAWIPGFVRLKWCAAPASFRSM